MHFIWFNIKNLARQQHHFFCLEVGNFHVVKLTVLIAIWMSIWTSFFVFFGTRNCHLLSSELLWCNRWNLPGFSRTAKSLTTPVLLCIVSCNCELSLNFLWHLYLIQELIIVHYLPITNNLKAILFKNRKLAVTFATSLETWIRWTSSLFVNSLTSPTYCWREILERIVKLVIIIALKNLKLLGPSASQLFVAWVDGSAYKAIVDHIGKAHFWVISSPATPFILLMEDFLLAWVVWVFLLATLLWD